MFIRRRLDFDGDALARLNSSAPPNIAANGRQSSIPGAEGVTSTQVRMTTLVLKGKELEGTGRMRFGLRLASMHLQ